MQKEERMNSKLDFIFARRSIRRYQDKPVPENVVHDLLEAGMAAPSAGAKDPWRFVVITERGLLEGLAGLLPNGKMAAQAPLALVICGSLDDAHDHSESYMIQDCIAAIENLLLAVTALDLGACWLGVHPRQERIDGIRKLLTIPDGIVPLAAMAIGYPAEEKEPRTRFDADKVIRETW